MNFNLNKQIKTKPKTKILNYNNFSWLHTVSFLLEIIKHKPIFI